MVEKNKAEKIQSNLHLLSFPKQNEHIKFISHINEIKKNTHKEETRFIEKIDQDVEAFN